MTDPRQPRPPKKPMYKLFPYPIYIPCCPAPCSLDLGVAEGGHVLGHDVELHAGVAGGLHARHLAPLALRRELGVAELRRAPAHPAHHLLQRRRRQGLVQRHLARELPGADGQVDAAVAADHVAPQRVDLEHGQDELRPPKRVGALVRHLHWEVPHEQLVWPAAGHARYLADAVLRPVQVRPVVAVHDGVLTVRVVAPGDVRELHLARHDDGEEVGLFLRHGSLSFSPYASQLLLLLLFTRHPFAFSKKIIKLEVASGGIACDTHSSG
mmetsp:Transcript_1946/g.4397  ORF Transcript_1946/g.4397 Transcript_1946/m.4397 type:complete len:268 (+) Transcript_1946:191-994(+)